jgi:hypothetical protein
MGRRDLGVTPFQHSPFLDQTIAEMLGLIPRVLADGVVSKEEAEDLQRLL